jgi:hypothetical protein
MGSRPKINPLSVVLLIAAATMPPLDARDPYTFTFYSWDRHRTYTVTTQEVAYSLKFPGHWLYQPSLLLPGSETGNLRMLVFNSNLVSGSNTDQAIWVTTDINNTLQFPAPTAVLKMSQSSNICDMADARPLWDGTKWHVYVQALVKSSSGACGTTNVVVQAAGNSLYNLAWDVVTGTQQAKIVVAGVGAAGVGEDMQWFYSASAPNPFVTTYNDWGNPSGGTLLKAAYTADGSTNLSQWYSAAAAYSPYLIAQGYTSPYMYPDALLSGSLDEATFGPPGIGAQSSCYTSGSTANQYQYSRVVGYFPSPLQSNALGGVAEGGALRSIYNDSYGERMFRPRFARDSHGFIPLISSTSTQRSWYTFVIYNPMQITNSGGSCNQYSRWTSSDQEFAFSTVTITEQ